MMKFFRRHQKIILLMMAILMVLFLVPMAFEGRGPTTNPVIGRYALGGKTYDIKARDIWPSISELEILAACGRHVSQDASLYVRGRLGKDGALDWFLWTRQAAFHGIVVTEAERNAYFDSVNARAGQLAAMLPDRERDEYLQANRVSAERLNRIRVDRKVTTAHIYRAFDHLVALNKLSELMALSAVHVPEHDVRVIIRDISESVLVRLVVADTERLKDLLAEPAEEELEALFWQHRDRFGAEHAIGYRFPRRVNIEALVIDAEKLADRPELFNITDKDAFRYYQQNPDKFRPEATTEPDQTPAVKPFAEVIEQIRRELALTPPPLGGRSPAEERAVALLNQAILTARQSPRPVDYDGPSDSLAARIAEEIGIRPQVLRTGLLSRGEFSDAAPPEFGDLLERGQAVLREPYSILEQAYNAAPLLDAAQQLPPGFKPLQLNEQRAVYRLGNRFFIWRVTAADRERAPNHLNEVRDQVVNDARRIEAIRMARELLARIETMVQDGTRLDAARRQINLELNERARAARATTRPDEPAATQPDEPGPDHPAAQPPGDGPDTVPATQPGEASDESSQPGDDGDEDEEIDYLFIENARVTRRELSADQDRMFALWQQYQAQGYPFTDALRLAQEHSTILAERPPRGAPSPMVIRAAFELGEKLKSADTDLPEKDILRLVDDADRGVVALVLADRFQPASETDYQQRRNEVLDLLHRQGREWFYGNWYNTDQLRRRLSFEQLAQEDEE